MTEHSERTATAQRGEHLLLYDGICGLCNRVVRFVLTRDRRRLFDFASLQSATGRSIAERAGRNPDDLNTLYVVANYRTDSPRLLSKSRAALFVVRTLGGIWPALSTVGVLPTPLLDFFYDLTARIRYRVFGRYNSCPLPAPEHRPRFIDL
jgi:predicted DCC family thiol-disulfide oxidoreductase YuxK